MALMWVLHPVGNSDVGVWVGGQDARDEVRRRVDAVAAAEDHAELVSRLVDLDWDGRVTGTVSPLAAIVALLPQAAVVRLALVCTPATRDVADMLGAALRRAPDLFGREFGWVEVVETDDGDQHSGMTERNVVTALRPHLAGRSAHDDTEALVVWGSGSTQLALGMTDAATVAGIPWRLVRVDAARAAATWPEFNPVSDTGVDPIVPLLRRWHFHDRLARLAETRPLGLTDEQRRILRADADRWLRAHERPTADGLRLLVSDALARGDASSGFAIRRYVLAHYHELRERDADRPIDLERWATERWRARQRRTTGEPWLGELLDLVRSVGRGSGADRVRRSVGSESGQWLVSPIAEAFRDVGVDASHHLRPPRPAALRTIRAHLNDVAVRDADVAGLPWIEPAPAMSAWYVRLAGNADVAQRPDPLTRILQDGADDPVVTYLGLPREDVGLRFLLLGTRNGSAANAARSATEINALSDSAADWAMIPDVSTETWGADDAESLLRERFEAVRQETGAIVVVPTGHKGSLLSLIVAMRRLANDHGVPMFLRQLNTSGEMHRLPLRFGADGDLLDLAGEALSTIEFDLAARLLDACADTWDLAERTRDLARAVHCRLDGAWPVEFDNLGKQARATGLIAERLDVWAGLAAAHPGAAYATRALFGGSAAIDCSTTGAGIKRKRRGNNDRIEALFKVRNRLPTSHGDQPFDIGESSAAIAALLSGAAAEARTRREFATVRPEGRSDLTGLLATLRTDVADRLAAENARLTRHYVSLGAAAVDAAVESPGHPDVGWDFRGSGRRR